LYGSSAIPHDVAIAVFTLADVACLHITTIMYFERIEQSFQSSAGKHPDAHILQQ
jgi:hypothetical protein